MKIPDNALPITSIDWKDTVLLYLSKGKIKACGFSNDVLFKLDLINSVTVDKKGKQSYDFLNSLLSISNILSLGGLSQDSPIIQTFKNYDLNVIMSYDVHQFIKRKTKAFKKLLTPFEFQVPEAFKDTSITIHKDEEEVTEIEEVDTKDNSVPGPFIHEVYSTEVNYYLNRIKKFGFDKILHEFQISTAIAMACKKGGFIGLEPGLGKTLISVVLAHMHGTKRVLAVVPGAAIGSFNSGWCHEIHRLGVPKSNIHVMRDAEDLPLDFKDINKYPDNGRPHFFITDYISLAKEKIQWSGFKCPTCAHQVEAKNKGICKGMLHPYGAPRSPIVCPICKHDKHWTKRACNKDIGGCGFAIHQRAVTVGKSKKGIKDPRPMWKKIKRNMFNMAFFDESQIVKNIASKRSQAVQLLPKIKRKYIITGTMMTNYIKDTFWQANLIFDGLYPINNKLKSYKENSRTGSEEKFINDFQYGDNGTSRIPELRNKELLWDMMSKIQIRYRADDPEVNNQIKLPDLNMTTEFIEMDMGHKSIYTMATGEFKNRIGALLEAKDLTNLSSTELNHSLNLLRLLSCVPEIDPGYNPKNICNKETRIIDLAKQEIDQGHKVVVFTSFSAFTEKLQERFTNYGWDPMVINGAVPIVARWPLIDQWRSSDKNKVLIAGIRSMNYAVNLTPLVSDFDCKTVIFGTPEWVPTQMEQAWKRVHRIGQTKPVKAYFIYAKDTIEEHMDNVLYKKREMISSVMDRVENYKREDTVVNRASTEIAKILLGSK